MCIICAKERNVKMPSDEIIENMWDNNSDGAGVAVARDGRVIINKGFMKKKSFMKFIKSLRKNHENDAMLLHFRIATHGGVNKECTHPFPVSQSNKELKKNYVVTDLAVAHNGIIKIDVEPGLSDTMSFIKKRLFPLKIKTSQFYKDKKKFGKKEKELQGSRLAFLDKYGNIYKIGEWEEKDGIYYSNSSYDDSYYKYLYGYGYGYDDAWGNYTKSKQFSITNAYPLEPQAINEDYPLFMDRKGKLYEYDEIEGCMWQYWGEYLVEDGAPLSNFNDDDTIFCEYIDFNEGIDEYIG